VGSIGYLRKRTSVIGDAVNFASRIEAANKQAGTNFLISEEAYREVKDRVKARSCHPVSIRGKSGTYNLYEVLWISESYSS
jgi:adenylate cyclase